MAHYSSPTVVQPNIPAMDMTPLERLILDQIFDSDPDADGIYYYASDGAADVIAVPADDLRAACEASGDPGESSIGRHAAALLAHCDAHASHGSSDDIRVDLTESERGWHWMFQDIVRRSATIDEIVVTTAFTCSRMRPDGFGGSVMLITADAIRYGSTSGLLEQFWNEAAVATKSPDASPPSAA